MFTFLLEKLRLRQRPSISVLVFAGSHLEQGLSLFGPRGRVEGVDVAATQPRQPRGSSLTSQTGGENKSQQLP